MKHVILLVLPQYEKNYFKNEITEKEYRYKIFYPADVNKIEREDYKINDNEPKQEIELRLVLLYSDKLFTIKLEEFEKFVEDDIFNFLTEEEFQSIPISEEEFEKIRSLDDLEEVAKIIVSRGMGEIAKIEGRENKYRFIWVQWIAGYYLTPEINCKILSLIEN